MCSRIIANTWIEFSWHTLWLQVLANKVQNKKNGTLKRNWGLVISYTYKPEYTFLQQDIPTGYPPFMHGYPWHFHSKAGYSLRPMYVPWLVVAIVCVGSGWGGDGGRKTAKTLNLVASFYGRSLSTFSVKAWFLLIFLSRNKKSKHEGRPQFSASQDCYLGETGRLIKYLFRPGEREGFERQKK